MELKNAKSLVSESSAKTTDGSTELKRTADRLAAVERAKQRAAKLPRRSERFIETLDAASVFVEMGATPTESLQQANTLLNGPTGDVAHHSMSEEDSLKDCIIGLKHEIADSLAPVNCLCQKLVQFLDR